MYDSVVAWLVCRKTAAGQAPAAKRRLKKAAPVEAVPSVPDMSLEDLEDF